jgi:hypothetical protein
VFMINMYFMALLLGGPAAPAWGRHCREVGAGAGIST